MAPWEWLLRVGRTWQHGRGQPDSAGLVWSGLALAGLMVCEVEAMVFMATGV